MNEWQLIRKIKALIPRSLQGELGIGDDADFIHLTKNHSLVFTNDVIVEGVDFDLSIARFEQVGYKSLAINLSDLAAMGVRPLGYLVALGLPVSCKEPDVIQLYKGILKLAKPHQIKCLGGDLSKSQKLFISITALGVPFADRAITRSEAKKDDLIAVTGFLGGSITKHHLDFVPRIKESAFLSKYIKPTAMIDISDGFVQDLEHLLSASHLGCQIDLNEIPVSGEALKLAHQNPDKALRRALSDGEDFELLFTISPAKQHELEKMWKKKFPKTPLSFIGKTCAGKKRITWLQNGAKLKDFQLTKKGYSHFS